MLCILRAAHLFLTNSSVPALVHRLDLNSVHGASLSAPYIHECIKGYCKYNTLPSLLANPMSFKFQMCEETRELSVFHFWNSLKSNYVHLCMVLSYVKFVVILL